MKKVKKLLSFGLLAVVVISCLTLVNVSAAGNYHDEAFTFSVSTGSQERRTFPRDKLDTTSSYMKYKSHVTVLPSNWTESTTPTYKGIVNAVSSAADEVYYDCGNVYQFTEGSAKYMINYVKERGWNKAAIRVFDITYAPISPSSITYYTLWSPDSI